MKNIIIDTDPGVDDILALIFALASRDLNILAITTVHGNIDLFNTTRNVLSLFNVLHAASTTDQSTAWANKLFRDKKVTVAAGATHPLIKERQLDAAYFHGIDGLGGVSTAFPQYLPPQDWHDSFPALRTNQASKVMDFNGVKASQKPAHLEILDLLASEPPNSITIIALGPLTNLSLACSHDYQTFSKVKEIVSMGGAITVPGNVTPSAEFNFLADPESASHLLSFTSPSPISTHPSSPKSIDNQVSIKLMPLDTTTQITITQESWTALPSGLLKSWCDVFINKTFETMKSLYSSESIEQVFLSMHDPACIWYLLPPSHSRSGGWREQGQVDLRVEIEGRWFRGSCCTDRRFRTAPRQTSSSLPSSSLPKEDDVAVPETAAIAHEKQEEAEENAEAKEEGEKEEESDKGSWLSPNKGNRVTVVSRELVDPLDPSFINDFRTLVFPE